MTDKHILLNKYNILKILTIVASIVAMVISCIKMNPDNDAFYMAKTGEYIFQNRLLPEYNIFTMHFENKMFVQQWLCCLFNYFAFSIGTPIYGSIILALLESCILICCACLCTKEVLGKQKAWIGCLFVALTCSGMFAQTRPYLLTVSCILIEVYLLERYANHKSKLCELLIGAFILSMFQSNFQCASLPLLAVIAFCYLIGIIINHKKACILLVIPSAILGAIINPNGIDAILYGIVNLSSSSGIVIAEMRPPSIFSYQGVLSLFCLIILLFYMIKNKSVLLLNFSRIFISALFIIMSFKYKRCQELLLFVLLYFAFPLLDSIKDIKIHKEMKETFLVYALTALVCLSIIYSKCTSPSLRLYDIRNWDTTPFAYLEEHESTKDISIFTDFSEGSMFVYYGYHPYIDSRMEVYTPRYTGGNDIWSEYIDMHMGDIDVVEFINKYHFDYFSVYEHSKIWEYLSTHPEQYKLICNSNNLLFYKTI